MLHLADIFDQPEALDWIRRAHEADRLPHGLIFAGPAGVGKGTTAFALGSLFLCHKPKGPVACGACESCRLVASGTHPDLKRIYRQLIRQEKDKQDRAARDISIDLIRQHVLEVASLKPMLAHGRVFVIEEADLMSAPAQNALLKTLEEPGGRTLIILLTDAPESLLPTIRSRCQRVRFGLLQPATVARELQKRGIDPNTARQAAMLAQGSLGLALLWIEQGVIEQGAHLMAQVENLLAGKGLPGLADWLKTAIEAYAKAIQEKDEKASLDQAKREGAAIYLGMIARRLDQALGELADASRIERACTAIEQIHHAVMCLDANVNIPLVLQHIALTLETMWE